VNASRYAEVWTETINADEAIREQRRAERDYRRMLGLTDRLLGRLEQLNLSGHRELDEETRRDIALTLLDVTEPARDRFPSTNAVQKALDGMFDVQESLLLTLQRMVHWDRLLSAPWDAGVAGGDQTASIRRSA
jgi:hypothetical protein